MTSNVVKPAWFQRCPWAVLLLLSLTGDGGSAALAASPAGIPGEIETAPRTAPLLDPSPPIAGRVDPATYRVGPGDEFAIRYSDLVDPRILRVGPEGDLVLPDVGPLSVAGLTLNELEARVRERMRPYVRGRGFVFSLYRPRRFRLYVTGEVERPGAVTLQAPVRASEAIEAAGGVAWSGAHRGIQIRRGTDTLRVDLVLASRGGDLATDPLVFESDVLFVPPLGRHVEVFGAVAHPGRYDFAAGDRMSTLVALAGGALPEAALTDATIERFDAASRDTAFLHLAERSPDLLSASDREYVVTASRERRAISANVGRLLARGDPLGDVPLHDGDRIVVPRRVPLVSVQGQVKAPGYVPYTPGRDVSDYVKEAGGYTSRAHRGRVSVTLAATGAQVSADEAGDLRPGDVVWVPTRPDRSTWSTVRDVLTTAAQVATVYLVVHQATK